MVPVTHGQLWQSHHSPQEAEMVGTRQSLPPHGSWEVPMGTGGAEDTHSALCHPQAAVMRSQPHPYHPRSGSGMSHFGPSTQRWQ